MSKVRAYSFKLASLSLAMDVTQLSSEILTFVGTRNSARHRTFGQRLASEIGSAVSLFIINPHLPLFVNPPILRRFGKVN